jgi:hypothetical protein
MGRTRPAVEGLALHLSRFPPIRHRGSRNGFSTDAAHAVTGRAVVPEREYGMLDDEDRLEESTVEELDITWFRALSVWWLMMWRTTAMSALVGLIVSLAWSIVAHPNAFTSVVAAVLAMPLGVVAVRMALRKTYRGFRLAAIAKAEPVARTKEAPPAVRKPAVAAGSAPSR